MINQRRIPGITRSRINACAFERIANAVEREAQIWGVSKSFVISNALAFTFGIKLEAEDNYKQTAKRKKK